MVDTMMLAETVRMIGDKGMGMMGGAIGCGLAVIGGGLGIGMVGGSAIDGIARQPEVAGRIFTTMIVTAALIEGFSFFAMILCLMVMK